MSGQNNELYIYHKFCVRDAICCNASVAAPYFEIAFLLIYNILLEY